MSGCFQFFERLRVFPVHEIVISDEAVKVVLIAQEGQTLPGGKGGVPPGGVQDVVPFGESEEVQPVFCPELDISPCPPDEGTFRRDGAVVDGCGEVPSLNQFELRADRFVRPFPAAGEETVTESDEVENTGGQEGNAHGGHAEKTEGAVPALPEKIRRAALFFGAPGMARSALTGAVSAVVVAVG